MNPPAGNDMPMHRGLDLFLTNELQGKRGESAGHEGSCDTHGNVVQSPLVVLHLKVRKGGGFFYGKSSNENHIEGV